MTKPARSLRILYIGVFDAKTYSRGRILYKGLRECGIDVDLFLPSQDKYCSIIRRLQEEDYDIILATGKFVFWCARIFGKKPLVFEASTSDYDTLVINRRTVSKWSPIAWLLWLGDKVTCHAADLTILDTEHHIEWHRRTFRLQRTPFSVVHVGADEQCFYPTASRHKGFNIMYWGTYIPLHGLDHVLDAATILQRDPRGRGIAFHLLGKGQEFERIRSLIAQRKLQNIVLCPEITIANGLNAYLSDADLCLGMFGKQSTSDMVIPHKVFEALAIRKPLLTGTSPAVAEIFNDREDLLFCKRGSGKAIAAAILELKRDKAFARRIADNGYRKYRKSYTNKGIGQELLRSLRRAL